MKLPPRRYLPNGYTLIELLVVLAIMGFMVALAPPLLQSGRPVIQARAAAYLLAARLTAAHDEAIESQTLIRVSLPMGKIVQFFPDGSATAVTVPEKTFLVSVAPLSGRVTVDE